MKKLIEITKNIFLTFVFHKFWSILLMASVVLLTMLYSCGRTQEESKNLKQKSEAIKVVTFGGTVMDGTSAKLDVFHDCFKWGTTDVNMVRRTQTWWSILERILTDWVEGDVEIISSGVAGNTAANGIARLEDDVLLHSPDYVLMMFGMDDVLAGVETDSFREDLEKIVNRVKEEKVNIVLLTPPPVSERMTINCTMEELRQRQTHLSELVQVIRDLAKEKSLPLIDFHQYFLDNRLAYDHLFEGWLPDAVAQTAMAPFVAGELLPVMGVDNYPNPTLCDYRKVYSDAGNPLTKHNGFTDLTCFEGEFFVVFRSGQKHGVPHPTTPKSEVIVVLRSQNGVNWVKEATLKKEGLDNRDPKFFQTDGSLIVYIPCTKTSDLPYDHPKRVTYGFERLGKGNWGEPFPCAPCILWRPRKWHGQYVSAGYPWRETKEAAVKLFSSEDGRIWKVVSHILPFETEGGETDLFIVNDRLTAYSRTGKGSNHELLISTWFPDEDRWETVSSGRFLHAPNVFNAGERLMITGRYCSQSDDRFRDLRKDWRLFTSGDPEKEEKADMQRVEMYHHGLRTGLFWIDGTKPRLVMEFLSAGDCSYTGVAKYGDEYLIRDYSMHEYYPEIKRPGDWKTPSDIYVSRIRFGE